MARPFRVSRPSKFHELGMAPVDNRSVGVSEPSVRTGRVIDVQSHVTSAERNAYLKKVEMLENARHLGERAIYGDAPASRRLKISLRRFLSRR